MNIERICVKIKIIGLFFILFSFKMYSQGIVKFNKTIDKSEVVCIGIKDSSEINKPKLIEHYLLLKKNDIVVDTIWKNYSGALNNGQIQIIDVTLKGDSLCSFLLSMQFGIRFIICKKIKPDSVWLENRYKIMSETQIRNLEDIYILDENSIKCEYNNLQPEIYKVISGTLRKYVEKEKDGKKELIEVEIINKKRFIDIDY